MHHLTPGVQAPSRPIMRYHGGKWILAPWIISHIPAHRVYVEPFGGAASVLLRKPRSHGEVYNDLDLEVVNVFRVLRDPEKAAELERLLRLTPFARVEFEESYEPSEDPVEQARRTITRSLLAFSSDGATRNPRHTGFRGKGSAANQAPANDFKNYPDHIALFTDRLTGVCIESKPALDLIRHQDGPETLFYVDPPYLPDTRCFRWPSDRRYRHELTEEDHVELAGVLGSVEGMVIISAYDHPLYDELYQGWDRRERDLVVFKGKKQTEVLWLSPNCRQDLPLFKEAKA